MFWIVMGFCGILLAGCFGVWVGWGLGAEQANKEHDEWEQAELAEQMRRTRAARERHPVYRNRPELLPPPREVALARPGA